ncbi:MAG TPA: hypothetical protein VFW08_00235 [bacterium]|nr:hypothetical protein [bacterium]
MGPRLKLDRVECRTDAQRVLARVELSLDDDARSGGASLPVSPGAWQRAVAEATLHAVSSFVGGAFAFTLDTVTEVRTGRYPLVVVTFVMHDGRREVFLSGTAPLGDHPHAAVARAVLHGLNRWVEPMLERELRPAPHAPQPGQTIH